MATLQKVIVSLRFQGDDLDPREISYSLGVDATWAYKKGVVQNFAGGKRLAMQTGIWSLTVVNPTPIGLDDEIAKIFSRLARNLNHWKSIAKRFDGHLFCGLFLLDDSEGIRVHPATLRAIGERGLALDLDIYDESDIHEEGARQHSYQ